MSRISGPLLALDIGTRKVAGVVAESHGKGWRVVAARVMEHPDRAMLDGQVHKIDAVAEVVRQVKHGLEKDTGLTFQTAAVAAAGRTLLTESATHSRRFPHPVEITREDILGLELAAARAAQQKIQANPEHRDVYCVGYSAVRFYLDQQLLDDLVGHRGQEVGVDVLATFLPRHVVDSLMAVLRRAGLTAQQLTLEPIAAMEVTIPADLRRMNLALVDVGAGTSDIALTREGAVFAYAMVTQAGDEITERLCEHFLLEFLEGERLKKALTAATTAPLRFKTLLGREQELPVGDIREVLMPAVRDLAQAIAERILALNGSAPRAVVMVGGGSATPGLGESLALALDIEAERVGVRGPETIRDLHNATGALTTIQGVTPLGIAWSALTGQGMRFIDVEVNGQPVHILALADESTVFEALLASGLEMKGMIPRPGRAITYTLQGRMHTLPGTLGDLARFWINQQPANLDTVLHAGDCIRWDAAQDGTDAVLRGECVPRPQGPFWCTLNGQHQDLDMALFQDQTMVAENALLPDRAVLTWASRLSLRDLIPELQQDAARPPFVVRVNGQERNVAEKGFTLTANGQRVDDQYHPQPNDRIEWSLAADTTLSLQDVVPDMPPSQSITVKVNGQPRTLTTGGSRVLINGKPAAQSDPVPNHSDVLVESIPSAPPLLSHVLEGLDLKPSRDAGPIRIKVNGKEAGFATPLQDGAEVEIRFG